MPHGLLRVGMAAASLLLIGCSITPGVADGRSSLRPLGRQLVHPEELYATCGGITQTIGVCIKRIQTLREKAQSEEAALPATVEALVQRAFGGKSASSTVIADIAKERARAEALNAALQEKGCKGVDIDGLLAAGAKPEPRTRPK